MTMEQAASVEDKHEDIIVSPVLGTQQDHRLMGLLNAIGLVVQSGAGRVGQGEATAGRTSAWVADDRDTDALAELAEVYPDARFLLFFETPADYLAHLLAKGERPDDHYAEWSNAARQRLAFVQRHRGRSMLVDFTKALAIPAAFAARCREFGVQHVEPAATADAKREDIGFERWLIAEWLKGDEEFGALAAELEASAHPLVGEIESSESTVVDQVIAYADRIMQRQQQQAEKDELVEENELLLLQLHQVQEELETYFLENQRLRETGAEPSTTAPASHSVQTAVPESFKHPSPEQKGSPQPSSRWTRRAERKKRKRDIKLIRDSEWFDGKWYLETYPDVAEAGMDPAEHYLRFGASEGRNPSKRFDTDGYLTMHYDVRAAGMNPLLHYVRYGKDEGRALPPERPVW